MFRNTRDPLWYSSYPPRNKPLHLFILAELTKVPEPIRKGRFESSKLAINENSMKRKYQEDVTVTKKRISNKGKSSYLPVWLVRGKQSAC